MSRHETDHEAFAARLRSIRPRLVGPWSLCDFLGKTEREDLAGQTVIAAVVNLGKRGEPFSFKGEGLGGCGEYGDAYRWLVDCGYFREGEREGRTVIFPTERLVGEMEAYFRKEESAMADGR